MVTRAQTVTAQLREMIREGEITASDRLSEVRLAADLGVSRTPVRDALNALEKEGLLTYEANRGHAVRAFSIHDLLDAFDLRATLEGMVCRLVAERGLQADVRAALQSCLDRAETLLDGPDWHRTQQRAWFKLNQVFHETLQECAGNRFLTTAIRQTRRLPTIFDGGFRWGDEKALADWYSLEQIRQSHLEHTRVLDALAQGQAVRAEHLMREHVFMNRERLRKSFEAAQKPPKARAAE